MPAGLKRLLVLGCFCLVGFLIYQKFAPQDPGDRPSLYIGNGPVRIEAQQHAKGRGIFRKGLFEMSRQWYHEHPGTGPTHFDVTVTDSSCGPDARYDATEFKVTTGSAGSSYSFNVGIWGIGNIRFLEIDPQNELKVTFDPASPSQLQFGAGDDQLQFVRIAGSNCAFTPGGGTITVNQLQK